MPSRFQFEVEEARREARKLKLAAYSRNYRANLARHGVPQPRDVQRHLWSLLSRSKDWEQLTDALAVEMAKAGYDHGATRGVIARMLAQV